MCLQSPRATTNVTTAGIINSFIFKSYSISIIYVQELTLFTYKLYTFLELQRMQFRPEKFVRLYLVWKAPPN